jgi:hypothetical protein
MIRYLVIGFLVGAICEATANEILARLDEERELERVWADAATSLARFLSGMGESSTTPPESVDPS